jgi:hypothetical protein
MKTDGVATELAFGSRRIAFRLCREPRQRLRIVVTPDMKVEVHAPARVDEERVLAAVRARLPWIARTLDRVEQFQPLPAPRRYVSGETFRCLGRQYRLRIRAGIRQPLKLSGQFLELAVPRGTAPDAVRRAVEAWYRRRAREVFARCLEKWGGVAKRHGVPDGPWGLRTMRRRWGSCSATGRLTLNTALVQAPLHCVEYVIVHELCHRKRPSHDRTFQSLLGRILPDWQRRKDLLARLAI